MTLEASDAEFKIAEWVTVYVKGEPLTCPVGESVAGALLAAGIYAFGRHPVSGAQQGPFCLSGSCQACVIRVNGKLAQACRIAVQEGQEITLEQVQKTDFVKGV